MSSLTRRGVKALGQRLLAVRSPSGNPLNSGSNSVARPLEHRAAAAAAAAAASATSQKGAGSWRRFSTSAGNADSTAPTEPPWSLRQREGGTIVTATGGGGGGVHLQRCYTGRLSSGGTAAQAAAPRLSLSRLRQEGLSQLQATFLPSGFPATVAPGERHWVGWKGGWVRL